MIPEYIEQARRSREPGQTIPRRRATLGKRLARWAFVALVLTVLAVAGGWYYALSVMILAAVGGLMNAIW